MKKATKQIVAVLMTLIMLFTACPVSAFASLLENDPAVNRQILQALTEIADNEDTAREYYNILQQYGLLDEDGNAVENWSVTMRGEDVTLEEIRALLAGDYDPQELVWVDGTPITLENLNTILQIEDYVSYVKETYFTAHEWTEAQKESARSLANQINNGGITLTSTGAPVIGSSGNSQTARVSVEEIERNDETRVVTFVATLLNAAENQEASFEWIAVSGSRPVIGGTQSATVRLTSSQPSATFCVKYDAIPYDGDNRIMACGDYATTFFVCCRNIRNALFMNEKSTQVFCVYNPGSVLNDQILTKEALTNTTIFCSGNTEFSFENNPAFMAGIRWGILTHVDTNYSYIGGSGDIWLYGWNESAGDIAKRDADGNIIAWGDWGRYDRNFRESLSGYWDTHEDGDVWACKTVRYELTDYPTKKGLMEKTVIGSGSFTCYPSLSSASYSGIASCYYTLNDTKIPSLAADNTYSVPAGSYSVGEVIPITVRFSEPVQPNATLEVNGQTIKAAELSPSNVMTFPYTVPELTAGTLTIGRVTFEDIVGNQPETDTYLSGHDGQTVTPSGVTLTGPIKSHAFTGMEAAIDTTDPQNSKMTVSVHVLGLDDVRGHESEYVDDASHTTTATIVDNMTNWLTASENVDVVNGTWVWKNVKIQVDGQTAPVTFTPRPGQAETVVGQTLTATFDLPKNTDNEPSDCVAELLVDDALVIGMYALVQLEPVKYITDADMQKLTLTVTPPSGRDFVYNEDSAALFSQDYDVIRAEYQFKNTGPFTYDAPEDLVWESSDPSVADISQVHNGKIGRIGYVEPTGKAGTVKFILKATNGNVPGKEVCFETVPLRFAVSDSPYLKMHNETVLTRDQQELKLYWDSNLITKNGGADTVFTVTVTRDGASAPEFTKTVTGNADNYVSSVLIDAGSLRYLYEDGTSNEFTARVTATLAGKEYKASVKIVLEPQPAKVTLAPLDDYFILDSAAPVQLSWEITDFDQHESAASVELYQVLITRGNDSVCCLTDVSALTSTGDGSFTGSYMLDANALHVALDPSDPYSYRDVYTITVQVKNGTDSTWSYDSCILYVYSADTLKLWINGAAPEVDPETGALLMSNRSAIAEMYRTQGQDAIIALKRDIKLREVVSANYGDYAWSELADQIAWASSDNSVATINYQQGSMYDDIRNYAYTTYTPATEFALSGLSDGETTITATHARTGMRADQDVKVETLTDQLYLFQCYPQVKTTLSYTNGDGQEKTLDTDNNGAAAIYEESGIAGDVYCRSVGEDGYTYLGTFMKDSIESGERDSTKLNLYPCNNLNLRRAAYAYLYIKNPDGTPYTGKIVLRGGVFVNDVYRKTAQFSLNSSGLVDKSGEIDQIVDLGHNEDGSVKTDGKLEIIMDQTQWGLEGNQIKVGDDVTYLFLIKQEGSTAYYPIFAAIDLMADTDAFVASGEAAAVFRKNESAGAHPFVIQQFSTIMNTEKNYSSTTSVLDQTGKVGPNDDMPRADLTTIVLWWGEETDKDNPQNKLRLRVKDDNKIEIAKDYSTQENETYDFLDEVVTSYTVQLTNKSLKGILASLCSCSVCLDYYNDGKTLIRTQELPMQLCNLTTAGEAERSQELLDELGRMSGSTGANLDTDMDFGDDFVRIMFDTISIDSKTNAVINAFDLLISPTSDPTKFLGFIRIPFNDTASSGVYLDSVKQAEYKDTPILEDCAKLVTFGKKLAWQGIKNKVSGKDYSKPAAPASTGSKVKKDWDWNVSGYMETLIYFDFNAHKWKMKVLDGGFGASIEISASKTLNYQVGPVPCFVTLSAGGKAAFNFDALTTAYRKSHVAGAEVETAMEYLTSLRLSLYLSLFAGVGIDYSVVSFKLGIFGKITFTALFDWLNRPYLSKNNDAYMMATGKLNDEKANLSGQNFKIDGQIGLKFVVSVIGVKYEKVLYSLNFNLLDKSTGKQSTITELWKANQRYLSTVIDKLVGNGSASLTSVNGEQVLSLNLAPTLESRDYLEYSGRVWGTRRNGMLRRSAATDGVSNLESNTYPYADPEITTDGQLMVYLSDMENTDVTKTRACFAHMADGSYVPDGVIDDCGCGDEHLTVDGTGDYAVAAWTRKTAKINAEAGSVLTGNEQMMLLNNTDVYAAVYDKTRGQWQTTALTAENGAELAPTVAVNGKKAIVAWRNVSSSDPNSLTEFDYRDVVQYRIWNGETWSDTETFYNGTSGAIKSVSAAMMADGTAAVAYTLDLDGEDETIDDREIVYGIVGTDGKELRNVRATNNGILDENPQIAVVSMSDGAVDERFILAWYTSDNEDAVSDSAQNDDAFTFGQPDIRFLDIDREGIVSTCFPHSVSQMASESGVGISSGFRFARGAHTINDLSLVWPERIGESSSVIGTWKGKNVIYTFAADNTGLKKDAASDEETPFTYEVDKDKETMSLHFVSGGESSTISYAMSDNNTLVLTFADGKTVTLTRTSRSEKDVLKAVRFYSFGQTDDTVGVTHEITVADMPDATLIDHFDACSVGDSVRAVLLGTVYGENGETVTNTSQTVSGDTVQYTVPKEVSYMYTAQETYTDTISVPMAYTDLSTLKRGAASQVLFKVENDGIHPITSLHLTVGTPGDAQEATIENLQILPGETYSAWFDYVVPASAVADPEYTVTATFDQGNHEQTQADAQGTIYLNFPNLSIAGLSIVREEEGERDLQIKLSNSYDAKLEGSGRIVKISFWSDATCETKISDLQDIVIDDDESLKMIDEGGYCRQVTFDVESYIRGDSETVMELPVGGVPVYVLAEVLEPSENHDGTYVVLGDPVASDNCDSVVCENIHSRTGQDVILSSLCDVGAQGTTVATVFMQNTRMSPVTGQMTVRLLDEDGNTLEQKIYTGEDGDDLLTLAGEAKRVETFEFNHRGAFVDVIYQDITDDADNTELLELFSNELGVSLDDFALQEDGTYSASVTVDDVTSAVLKAVTLSSRSNASIDVNGTAVAGGSSVLSGNCVLNPARSNTITVTVTAENGDTRSYVLNVMSRKSIVVKANAAEKIYGEADPAFTYTAQGLVDGDTISVTFSREPGENVGAYDILAEIIPGDNYIASYVGAKLTVRPKEISVVATAKAKTYGSADPSLTYSVTGLVGKDKLTGALTRQAGETVGRYEIEQGTLAASDNYILNYTGDYLTIGPKTLTVRVDAQSKTFGDPDPELTYTVSGLIGDDTLSGALQREAGENVGKYAIMLGTLSNENYDIDFRGADLVIGKKTVTVTADAKEKIYAQAEPELTYTITGLLGDDQLSGALIRERGENVGTYEIRQGALSDKSGNYELTFIGADFTITPLEVIVTADTQSKFCAEVDPALTYRVEYPVEGTSLPAGTEIPGALVRTPGEDVGAYTISQGTLGSENYAMTFVPAELVISHRIQKVDAVEAGCITDGNKACFRCQGCGRLFADSEAAEEISADSVVIPAHGHKVEHGICIYCGKYRCSFCETYEAKKDIPVVGWIYGLVHYFVHLASHIGYLT
ncbi:MAG: cadherin-like beta sandwich domain-containing protein [Clostridia bacterium]|nr:cadherin-like beta sandwich domain-containing protein [Clostridia bacterium]